MTGEPIHSGKELYGNVDVLGMSAAELCLRIGVPGEPITRLPSPDDDYRSWARGGHSAITSVGAARKVFVSAGFAGSDGCAVVVNDDKYGLACAGVGLNALAFCLRMKSDRIGGGPD